MPDTSLATDGREPAEAFRGKVQAGEAGGAARVWIANHLFERDPVALASLALATVPRLPVALMAMSPFTVHPVQAAMAAATLDEMHPGRVTLCFGVGAPVDLAAAGITADKPVGAMREAIEIARALFAGEVVKVDGRRFKANGRMLAGGRREIPIVLAASGPQMLELAGAVADGVLISAGTSVEFVRSCIAQVKRGSGGRNLRTAGLVYAATDSTRGAADARVRRLLAVLLRGAHHRANLDAAGTPLDQQALASAAARGDWSAAEAMITAEVIDRHAACGTAAEVRARIAAYHDAGLDEIVLSGPRDAAQAAALLNATK
jgi:5,10-methylenetetrahydromethanopterin reductase